MVKISTKINLHVTYFEDQKLKSIIKDAKGAIRLFAHIQFLHKEDVEDALVDTGAHVSLIPYGMWMDSGAQILDEYIVRGMVSKPECEVKVKIGRIKFKLLDDFGHMSSEKEILAYLALTNEVPLILGFRDLLETGKLHLDFANKEFWVEV